MISHTSGWRLNIHRLTVNEMSDFARITHQGKMIISSVADLGKIANPLAKIVEKWPYDMNPHSTISYLLLSEKQIDDLCHVLQTEIFETIHTKPEF